MKKFNVHLYFEGSYAVDVVANNESEALDIAREQIINMSDTELLDAIGLQGAGCDIYENTL
jgi:hypothetical protein